MQDSDVTPASDAASAKGTQSIHRALSVLYAVAIGREAGMHLNNITALTGLTRPTAHRILALLADEGVVERNGRGRYAIGEQIFHLSLARSSRPLLLQAAEHHLAHAAESLQDTVFLSVRSQADTLCIARWIGSFPIQVLPVEVGGRRPIGVASAGVAILAAMSQEMAVEFVNRNSQRLRSCDVDIANLLDEVAICRDRGYTIRRKGLVPGTVAMSSPVDGTDDPGIAAITVVGTRRRFTNDRIEKIAEVLRYCRDNIEKAFQKLDSANPIQP